MMGVGVGSACFQMTLFVSQVYEHLDGSKSLKLGDFGLATVVNGPLHTVCGTPTYVAPEIIAETGYTYIYILFLLWLVPLAPSQMCVV